MARMDAASSKPHTASDTNKPNDAITGTDSWP